ncbi:MAG: PrsW family intramembrane metalloprotease [Dehalococcoidia bacterium]|nr:MAG: PrsW family intramembrane metalloprotease [bacterium]MCK6565932.1 PrsW family intramembrane metalloprotease [Dehalococcoidia bacterium]MCL4230321.1 PrsW family intramembrane metalloprotease [Dehalococcoidia bacterium]NUQ55186.1 PrsW family intramembrane metalloprotease [Dehalococcoidia bacterium]
MLLALPWADDDPEYELFLINLVMGTAAVYMLLGGVLVVQAASALGGTGSSAMRLRRPWLLIPLFPAATWLGQWLVNHPERLPWLFPVANLAVVSVPSLLAASVVAVRYSRRNPLAWPVSWREWSSGFIYGAVGATTIGAIINTLYLIFMGAFLIHRFGEGDAFDLSNNLPTLPRGWGLFFDLTVLSVVAPLNEEFWKGALVALFFYRRGGAARCFLWGTLAGAGFNLLETFDNSVALVSPEALADQTMGNQWWLFAVARMGTGGIHALASGLSALGFYALLRRHPRYLVGYPLGVLVHGSWNFLTYALSGDQFFSTAGPDSQALDILSIAGMAALFVACATLLWVLPGRLRDESPAPIYSALGMLPARPRPPGPAGRET